MRYPFFLTRCEIVSVSPLSPLQRANCERPRLVNDSTGLDALLWVKLPGESDGTCNGGPAAGQWWQEMALEMMASPYGGPGCAVVLGRSGGPAFRPSELGRLAHLAGIATTVASLPPP